jgi:hypothetical protein
MTKPIWIQKSEEREDQIRSLIYALDRLNTDEAKITAGALDRYLFRPAGMAHKQWVDLRLALMKKAQTLLQGREL